MDNKLRFSFLSLIFLLNTTAYSDNSTLIDANNLASINLFGNYQEINYFKNPNRYPLHNLYGNGYGVNFGISKTVCRVYGAVDLTATNADLSYTKHSLKLSQATSFLQTMSARLGYLFTPVSTVGLTPYFTLGYQHWQLDTGGISHRHFRANGITQIYQAGLYGVGLLSQWAVTPRWVVAGDVTVGQNFFPWTYASLPKAGTFIMEQTNNLGTRSFWQMTVKSDYKLTSSLHGLLSVQYGQSGIGGGQTNPSNQTFPSQQIHFWQYGGGLGFQLDNIKNYTCDYFADRTNTLIAANNQAKLNLGYIFQNYGELNDDNKTGYLDRQAGHIPVVGIVIDKTFRNIFIELAMSEAIGVTRYIGSNIFTHQQLTSITRNTMTDGSARLGYQYIITPFASMTPYGVIGFHRWLRAIFYPETYHNNWSGLGVLFQFSPANNLVISLDGNAGRTSNAQIHTWNTFHAPHTFLFGEDLHSRTYVMAGVGGDYQFAKNWHLLANMVYWRYNYDRSAVNDFHDFEPTSDTRLVTTTIGVGYGLA